jgi:shikimate dehydrogenase
MNDHAATRLCALLGESIGYSLSPRIHALLAEHAGLSVTYGLVDVPGAAVASAIRDFFAAGGRGMNVTVPHKVAAARLCDVLSPAARRSGAVNTICLDREGHLVGENTDGLGLLRDLVRNLGLPLQGASVLLIGAGGAARGVASVLLQSGVTHLVIANRTAHKAQLLARELEAMGRVAGVGWGQLALLPETGPFDLIINATPAGRPGEDLHLPETLIGPETVAYDMNYRGGTAFQVWARGAGASRVIDGLGMLVEQAAASFQLWHDAEVATGPILHQLRAHAALPSTEIG